MSVARKGADGFLLQVMVLLCALWGFQQVAIKLAAPDLSTLLQVALRSALAAAGGGPAAAPHGLAAPAA